MGCYAPIVGVESVVAMQSRAIQCINMLDITQVAYPLIAFVRPDFQHRQRCSREYRRRGYFLRLLGVDENRSHRFVRVCQIPRIPGKAKTPHQQCIFIQHLSHA